VKLTVPLDSVQPVLEASRVIATLSPEVALAVGV
jgi:hypothetical protein